MIGAFAEGSMSTPSSSPSSKPSSIASGDTFRRVEIISGVARHRIWPADVKAAIILETLQEGACVSEIARRHNVSSGLVFKWRRKARRQSLAQPPAFAEVKVTAASQALLSQPSRDAPVIEMEAEGVCLRVPSSADRNLILTLIEGLGGLKRRR
jgi:transposase